MNDSKWCQVRIIALGPCGEYRLTHRRHVRYTDNIQNQDRLFIIVHHA